MLSPSQRMRTLWTPPVFVSSDPQVAETKHTLTSSRRRTGSLHPSLTAGCGYTLTTHHNNVKEWCNDHCLLLFLIMLHSQVGNTCMWDNLPNNVCVSQKSFSPTQEVINTRGSWLSEVWYGSQSAFFSWLYLCCSERWQPVAQGFVFCFHGRSQMCMCVCQTKPPSCCNTWRVSPNLNFALSSVTQLSGSVNHGGVSFLKKLILSVCCCRISPWIQ